MRQYNGGAVGGTQENFWLHVGVDHCLGSLSSCVAITSHGQKHHSEGIIRKIFQMKCDKMTELSTSLTFTRTSFSSPGCKSHICVDIQHSVTFCRTHSRFEHYKHCVTVAEDLFGSCRNVDITSVKSLRLGILVALGRSCYFYYTPQAVTMSVLQQSLFFVVQ